MTLQPPASSPPMTAPGAPPTPPDDRSDEWTQGGSPDNPSARPPARPSASGTITGQSSHGPTAGRQPRQLDQTAQLAVKVVVVQAGVPEHVGVGAEEPQQPDDPDGG